MTRTVNNTIFKAPRLCVQCWGDLHSDYLTSRINGSMVGKPDYDLQCVTLLWVMEDRNKFMCMFFYLLTTVVRLIMFTAQKCTLWNINNHYLPQSGLWNNTVYKNNICRNNVIFWEKFYVKLKNNKRKREGKVQIIGYGVLQANLILQKVVYIYIFL